MKRAFVIEYAGVGEGDAEPGGIGRYLRLSYGFLVWDAQEPEFTLSVGELIVACRTPSESCFSPDDGGKTFTGSAPKVTVWNSEADMFVHSTVPPTRTKIVWPKKRFTATS